MTGLPSAKLAIFLVFVFSCDAALGQLFLPFAGQVIVNPDKSKKCEGDNNQLMCNPDKCDEIRWCRQTTSEEGIEEWTQYAVITCDQSTNERYCNNGTCSKTPMSRCSTMEFSCPEVDGLYPDPSNCSRYHICGKGVAIMNECPTNNVYDHNLGSCKYRRTVNDCILFKCGKEGQSIVYPADDRIYGKCFSGKAYISGRCLGHERYNVLTDKCERHCRSAGPQPPDPGHCGKFVLCAEVAPRTYKPVEMSCGCDQAYDDTVKRCVNDAPCVKNNPDIWCKKPIDDGESGAGNGGGNNGNGEENGEETSSNTEKEIAALVNFKNTNCNGNKNLQFRTVQRRNVLNTLASQQDNNNDSDAENASPAAVSGNSDDNNNNAGCDDNDADGNLINVDNNDNNENFKMKERENFIRFIFDWVIRIIVGQPMGQS